MFANWRIDKATDQTNQPLPFPAQTEFGSRSLPRKDENPKTTLTQLRQESRGEPNGMMHHQELGK